MNNPSFPDFASVAAPDPAAFNSPSTASGESSAGLWQTLEGIDIKSAYEASDTGGLGFIDTCLLYTSPSPRDATLSRMPSSA